MVAASVSVTLTVMSCSPCDCSLVGVHVISPVIASIVIPSGAWLSV